ncbi:serine hydrolase domain-containing protein [Actinospongicola halichondriae]|uniref:serine hydrolase domain-containing protein n=1 Tax=Actinospongicola halichondriae TaxID=3236844 RepID=UPI003D5951CC
MPRHRPLPGRPPLLAALVATVALAAGSCAGTGEDAATTSVTDAVTSTSTVEVPPVAVPAFPPQPAGVPWPTEEWTYGDLPAGVDGSAIDEATDTAFNDGAGERVRAVVIVHGGQIVYERYSPHRQDGPAEVYPSYSIAKSVTSAAIGILVGDGVLEIDEPAPVPEWHADPDDPRADITLGQMLHMSTGMPWDDGFGEDGSTLDQMLASGDMAAFAAEQEPVAPPGEQFVYNTGTSTLLARIVGEAAGGDARQFLDDRLFGPIGMSPVHTAVDRAGTWSGGISADSTAKGFARFGLLYLRGGQWDGAQVIPEDWVEYSRTPSPTEPEYGAHWWVDPLRPGVSYAMGFRGQVITVDPMHDLVIVQLSTVGGPLALDHTEAILDAFEGVE